MDNPSFVINLQDVANNVPSFPSQEFGDFMNIIIRQGLSESAGNEILKFTRGICRDDVILPTSIKQGYQIVDKMNISHLEFQKTSVMTYKDETYYLFHRPIFDAIKELLLNKELFKSCTFDYIPLFSEGERVYGEQYNGRWWRRVQTSLPVDGKVLSIILYSDATICDILGKSSEHPVYLTLGNISNWRRNKPDAKAIIGYLPKIKAITDSEKRHNSYLEAKRFLYQRSFEIITKTLLDYKNRGMKIITPNGDSLWCFPFISQIIGDIPEQSSITLTYSSINCKCPCSTCLVSVDDLNNIDLEFGDIYVRTPQNMQKAIADGDTKEFSIHETENIFWKYP
jgi:hypothetical protein